MPSLICIPFQARSPITQEGCRLPAISGTQSNGAAPHEQLHPRLSVNGRVPQRSTDLASAQRDLSRGSSGSFQRTSNLYGETVQTSQHGKILPWGMRVEGILLSSCIVSIAHTISTTVLWVKMRDHQYLVYLSTYSKIISHIRIAILK